MKLGYVRNIVGDLYTVDRIKIKRFYIEIFYMQEDFLFFFELKMKGRVLTFGGTNDIFFLINTQQIIMIADAFI